MEKVIGLVIFAFIIGFMMLMALSHEESESEKDQIIIRTKYIHQIKDRQYPIFYSTKTKAVFIERIAKRGVTYRQYLNDDLADKIKSEYN